MSNLLFLVAFPSMCFAFFCSHGVNQHQQRSYQGASITQGRSIRSTETQLTIFVYYDISVEDLPETLKQLLKTLVINPVVKYWENVLQVIGASGRIHLQRSCTGRDIIVTSHLNFTACTRGCSVTSKCGDIYIPETFLQHCYRLQNGTIVTEGQQGEGVSADFILFVSVTDGWRCTSSANKGSTLAYASYCRQDIVTDRPVAGYINLCSKSLSEVSTAQHHLQAIVKHEILHALGFSSTHFAFYRDDLGRPLTPRNPFTNLPPLNETTNLYQWSDKVVKTITRPKWKVHSGYISKSVHLLVTPRVVEEVRKHFNCPSLEGAELEDYGDLETGLSHWEKRLFEDELMTGGYSISEAVSRLTLALMEDTGWFRANYSMASPMTWGQGLGCDFATKSCMEWMEQANERGSKPTPFCQHINDESRHNTECTDNNEAIASCNLIKFASDLPDEYQNFNGLPGVSDADIGKYGGQFVLADHCPYIQKFSWVSGDDSGRASNCYWNTNLNITKNYLLETHGPAARCFEHDGMWTITHCSTTNTLPHWGAGCYQYSCSSLTGVVIHLAGNYSLQCLYDDQVLSVNLPSRLWMHSGSIKCPKCSEVCQECPLPNGQITKIPTNDKKSVPCIHQVHPCFNSVLCLAGISLGVFLIIVIITFVLFRHKFNCSGGKPQLSTNYKMTATDDV